MLPKQRRIKDRKKFAEIYKKGKRFFGDGFTVFICKNEDDSRFACVVSQKVSKKAVVRNKLRRRIYSIIQRHLPAIKEGLDVIFVLKKEAVEIKYQKLEDNVLRALNKAGLFK